MLNGQIKPVVIKIFRSRFRYKRWKLPLMTPLRVIGMDMKYLLVTDPKVVMVYKVLWKDIQLVESEKIIQTPIVQSIDNSKTVNRINKKKSFFRSGEKLDKKE